MGKDFTQTRLFNSEEIKREVIHSHLMPVANALDERVYNAVHQITGYLISIDPAYISSHKGARSIIQQIYRGEIIAEIVKFYLESK